MIGTALAILGVHTIAFALVNAAAFNHDLAFIVVGGQKLLEGGRYGVEVIDPNPPLAWWFAAGFLSVGKFMGMPPQMAATLFTLALSIGSTVFVQRAAGTRLALVVAIILVALPGYDFGQREHWLAILALPWLIAAADWRDRRQLNGTMRALAAISGAAGFLLKPYFLLIPVIVELWFLWRHRSLANAFRIDNIALAGAGVGYALCVWAFAPQYYTRVLPDSLAIYWAFDVPFSEIVRLHAGATLLTLVGGAMALRASSAIPVRVQAFAAATIGALLAALLQMKGWQYHFLPARVFALAAALFLISETGAKAGREVVRLAALALLMFAAIAPTIQRREEAAEALRDERELSAALTRWSQPNESVFAFITSPRAVLPAVLRSGRVWQSSACCVQFLPAMERADERNSSDAALTRAVAERKLEDLIAALERSAPRVILIDDRDYKLGFGGKRFEYGSWLRQEPRLNRLLQRYHERRHIAGFRVFTR